MGLYLVKQRVEAMGGRVWVESAFGDGSTFFVSLPRLSDAEYKRRLLAYQNEQTIQAFADTPGTKPRVTTSMVSVPLHGETAGVATVHMTAAQATPSAVTAQAAQAQTAQVQMQQAQTQPVQTAQAQVQPQTQPMAQQTMQAQQVVPSQPTGNANDLTQGLTIPRNN